MQEILLVAHGAAHNDTIITVEAKAVSSPMPDPTTTPCETCGHPPHKPGQCLKCNCGESEIAHSHGIESDQVQVVTWENFNRGEVSTQTVTHIRSRKTGD